jgi:hypothetical protein
MMRCGGADINNARAGRDEDKNLPLNRKQGACFLSPPLVRGLDREAAIFANNGLICGHNNVILLQVLRGQITTRTIVYGVTQGVGHTMVFDLLFPVRKYRKWDHCNKS